MIREIIRPQAKNYTIDIPEQYLNMEIEILVFPVNTEHKHSDRHIEIIKKTSGILSGRKIDPLVWQKEIRGQWDNRT